MAIRKELDGVDIGLVAGERLDSLASSNIPQLGEGITGARDECVVIGGIDADAHNISQVIGKLSDFGSCLNIPFHARHVA